MAAGALLAPAVAAAVSIVYGDRGDFWSMRRDGSGKVTPLPEPSGDILMFQTESPGTRFAIRPSGTEPKIKLYLFARSSTDGITDRGALAKVKEKTRLQIDAIAADIEAFMAETLKA